MYDDELLTTTEAARLAGAGTSSVKRWADANLVPCVRTAGGHRRFRRADVERFLRAQGMLDPGPTVDPALEWVASFQKCSAHELQGELLRARSRLGAWFRVAEAVGAGLVELGNRWARGEITVLEEHVASEKVARAVQRIGEALPITAADPTAVLAAADGDDHTLGLALVELSLRECGWQTVWSGRKTPGADLMDLIATGAVQMVAISASEVSMDEQRLVAQAAQLGEACRRARCALVVGGRGAWPDRLPYGTRLHDFSGLHAFATALRSRLVHR